MAKIKTLLVDDEYLALQLLEGFSNKVPELEIIDKVKSPMAALDILNHNAIDLLFLDIQMPMLNGIEFVKSLTNPPAIIFITAYRDYAVESYELDVVDYLLKPITFNRFFKAINKFQSRQPLQEKKQKPSSANETNEESAIYVNSNRKYIKVAFSEVLFIESLKDYVRINTTGKNIVTKDKISLFEQKLPGYFLRIHRSFIVNTKKVTAFTVHDVEIEDQEIPIGISYRKEVLAFLKQTNRT